TLEAFQKIRIFSEAAGHHLDGDRTPNAGIYSLVNDTHAAFTEFVGDIVLTNLLNRVRRHEWATLGAQVPDHFRILVTESTSTSTATTRNRFALRQHWGVTGEPGEFFR